MTSNRKRPRRRPAASAARHDPVREPRSRRSPPAVNRPVRSCLPVLFCALALGACAGGEGAGFGRSAPLVADPAPEQMRHAQSVIRVVNDFRTRNGLPPLILEAHLMRAAEVKVRDFRTNWRFYHAGSDGLQPEQRVSRAGYRWVAVGETLAAGQSTARGAVGNLIASPCHRYALLRDVYLHAGAAYAHTPDSPPGRYKHWWVIKLARPSTGMNWDRTYPTSGAEMVERRGPPTRMTRPYGCTIRRAT